jgi:hypothetical protein
MIVSPKLYTMNYLCKDENGKMFVKYSDKDLTKYIGKPIMLSTGGLSYLVLQTIDIY